MTAIGSGLDCSHRVNDIVARHPTTRDVFHRFGLDTCCGGSLSVADAARAHGVDADTLCSELTAAIAAPAPVA